MSGPASRIAFVGCGAVVEQHHLPALRDCSGVACHALVDPDGPRIERLAMRHDIRTTLPSLTELPSTVQGVVVAVPNDLHVAVVTSAVRRGFDVLCEKPLGRSVAEVRTMVDAAAGAGRGLFAAMVCRRYPAVRDVVKHRLHELVGELRDVEASYGVPLDWPVKSPSFYDKARSGGGSLLDVGAHVLDVLLDVLGHPPFEVADYRDDADADAGVEAETEGRIVLNILGRPVDCVLRTSRLRRLPNAVILRGALGSLQIPMSATQPAVLTCGNGAWPVTGHLDDARGCFVEQLEDFGRAIRREPNELPTGDSQLSTIGLIEELYARRQPLTFTWDA